MKQTNACKTPRHPSGTRAEPRTTENGTLLPAGETPTRILLGNTAAALQSGRHSRANGRRAPVCAGPGGFCGHGGHEGP